MEKFVFDMLLIEKGREKKIRRNVKRVLFNGF